MIRESIFELNENFNQYEETIVDRNIYINPNTQLEVGDRIYTLKTEMAAAPKNEYVIDLFISDMFPKDKKPVWGTPNLRIEKQKSGWALVNYDTVLAYRPEGNREIYYNDTRYSVATSQIQSLIKSTAQQYGVPLINTDNFEIAKMIMQ